ncbi:UvrD-helicase domain-containing protein [Brevibacillus sp. SYP-B805]|uniref:HelD family protein n=1 Tax=Brevibacillus sp. SYP-B805 TaxID=1578199 RepID=UPI0013EC05F2|nr:UvrD-helicase domain-containing protein [Brevibacillus sp. SYP-B805]NGQ96353.1 UvrD-helicase domain-containing protein [Brevibacillus sp. SYP-B805]
MTVRHKDYGEEQKRLEETLSVIDREIALLREEIKEPTDDYVKQVVNYKKAKELRYLEHQGREKPYFGRVDFLKHETGETDSVYIGKRGIVRSDTFDSIVVDWRAPIASLYYSGESRDAYYRTKHGIVRGEVKLKRNFAIDQGKITGIYDGALKETINRELGSPDEFLEEGYIDEFLAASLNQTNDSRLKDIVATIQAEQNEIIRADKDKIVIVQGVAGSGKTTIALHRLSYLIYNYQDTLASKRFMVFAPNRLFLHYISEVLPELGVDDVQQATFLDWAAKLVKPILPKGWRILDPSKALMLFFEEAPGEEREKAWKRMRFKGSLACKETLDAYLQYLIRERIPFRDLRFIYNKTKQVFTLPAQEIRDLFAGALSHLPYRARVEALRKQLKQEMNKRVFAHLREQRIDLDKQGLARFERMIEQILDRYLEAWPSVDVFAAYREILTTPELLRRLAPPAVDDETLRVVGETSAALFAGERVEAEDIAPLLYLKHLLEGLGGTEPFDHAVVDEAQDLSPLEIAIVALMSKRQSVTIVGDIAQGIHAYRGLSSWDELLQGVFAGEAAAFYTLEQSYRSTIEIMKLANTVLHQIELPQEVKAKPVLRHGAEPEIVHYAARDALWADIVRRVEAFRKEGLQTVAIVSKTMEEGKKAYKALKPSIPDIALVNSKDTEFPGGVTIMPAYVTKGLQFDAVILLDADDEHYGLTEWDAKLLYVAMTRPVHRLLITCVNSRLTPLLQQEKTRVSP